MNNTLLECVGSVFEKWVHLHMLSLRTDMFLKAYFVCAMYSNVLNNEHVLSAQKEPKTQEIEDVALCTYRT